MGKDKLMYIHSTVIKITKFHHDIMPSSGGQIQILLMLQLRILYPPFQPPVRSEMKIPHCI